MFLFSFLLLSVCLFVYKGQADAVAIAGRHWEEGGGYRVVHIDYQQQTNLLLFVCVFVFVCLFVCLQETAGCNGNSPKRMAPICGACI